MCLRMISPIRRRYIPSPTFLRPLSSRASGRVRRFIRPSTRCSPIPKWPRQSSSVNDTIGLRRKSGGHWRNTRNSKISSLCSAWSNCRPRTATWWPVRAVWNDFLPNRFFATERFTGLKGKLVSREDTLDGCERILGDEFKDYPERALYMIGAVEEVKGKIKTVRSATKAEPGSKPGAKAEPQPKLEPRPGQ